MPCAFQGAPATHPNQICPAAYTAFKRMGQILFSYSISLGMNIHTNPIYFMYIKVIKWRFPVKMGIPPNHHPFLETGHFPSKINHPILDGFFLWFSYGFPLESSSSWQLSDSLGALTSTVTGHGSSLEFGAPGGAAGAGGAGGAGRTTKIPVM